MELYVAILKQAEAKELPDAIPMEDTITCQSLLDLISAGFLTGSVEDTSTGPTLGNISITESGKQLLDEYISLHDRAEKSRSHWLLMYGAALIALSILAFTLLSVY